MVVRLAVGPRDLRRVDGERLVRHHEAGGHPVGSVVVPEGQVLLAVAVRVETDHAREGALLVVKIGREDVVAHDRAIVVNCLGRRIRFYQRFVQRDRHCHHRVVRKRRIARVLAPLAVVAVVVVVTVVAEVPFERHAFLAVVDVERERTAWHLFHRRPHRLLERDPNVITIAEDGTPLFLDLREELLVHARHHDRRAPLLDLLQRRPHILFVRVWLEALQRHDRIRTGARAVVQSTVTKVVLEVGNNVVRVRVVLVQHVDLLPIEMVCKGRHQEGKPRVAYNRAHEERVLLRERRGGGRARDGRDPLEAGQWSDTGARARAGGPDNSG
mmetsp:Transcript_42064/g.112133  ORF Transcript_42064/g.112133 Transcript_42064/m.112133 type:complete len:328 (-) Transcript_42064:589-1572(-)